MRSFSQNPSTVSQHPDRSKDSSLVPLYCAHIPSFWGLHRFDDELRPRVNAYSRDESGSEVKDPVATAQFTHVLLNGSFSEFLAPNITHLALRRIQVDALQLQIALSGVCCLRFMEMRDVEATGLTCLRRQTKILRLQEVSVQCWPSKCGPSALLPVLLCCSSVKKIYTDVNWIEKWSVIDSDLQWENHSAMVDCLSLKLYNNTQTDALNSIISLYGRGIQTLHLSVGAWWCSESMLAIVRRLVWLPARFARMFDLRSCAGTLSSLTIDFKSDYPPALGRMWTWSLLSLRMFAPNGLNLSIKVSPRPESQPLEQDIDDYMENLDWNPMVSLLVDNTVTNFEFRLHLYPAVSTAKLKALEDKLLRKVSACVLYGGHSRSDSHGCCGRILQITAKSSTLPFPDYPVSQTVTMTVA